MYKMAAFMSRRMIACDEASFLISYRHDKHLGIRNWMQLKIHLMACHLCRKYASQIEQLDHAFIQYREACTSENCQHHLPPEAKERMVRIVSREQNPK